MARPCGPFNPETRAAFTVDPSVPYSPIVPPTRHRKNCDKQVRSRHGKANWIIQPRDQGCVHDRSVRAVFADRTTVVIRFKQIRPRHDKASRRLAL